MCQAEPEIKIGTKKGNYIPTLGKKLLIGGVLTGQTD